MKKTYLLRFTTHHPNADSSNSAGKVVMEVTSEEGVTPRCDFRSMPDLDSDDVSRTFFVINIYGVILKSCRIVQEIGLPTKRGFEISEGASKGIPHLAIFWCDLLSVEMEFPELVEGDQE